MGTNEYLYIVEYIAIIITVVFLMMRANDFFRYYHTHKYQLTSAIPYIIQTSKRFWYIVLVIPFIFILDIWYFQIVYSIYIVVMAYFYHQKRDKQNINLPLLAIFLYFLFGLLFVILGTLLMRWLGLVSLASLFALFVVGFSLFGFIGLILISPFQWLFVFVFKHLLKRKIKKFKPTFIFIDEATPLDQNMLLQLVYPPYIVLYVDALTPLEVYSNVYHGLIQTNTLFVIKYHDIKVYDKSCLQPAINLSNALENLVMTKKQKTTLLQCMNNSYTIVNTKNTESIRYAIVIADALDIDQDFMMQQLKT